MLENIKRLCKEQKIFISTLEERAGLSTNAIYRWDESKPSVDKVARVAAVLGVTVDALLAPDKPQENLRGG